MLYLGKSETNFLTVIISIKITTFSLRIIVQGGHQLSCGMALQHYRRWLYWKRVE